MSAHPKVTTATPTAEKIHVELPNLSLVKNVTTTTVSVVTVTSESTVLSVGSRPLEVTTESAPPETTIERIPLELSSALAESVPLDIPPPLSTTSSVSSPSPTTPLEELAVVASVAPTDQSSPLAALGSPEEINEPPRLTSGPDDQDQLITKARDDAHDLHRAFKGLSCDATTIVNILSKRSATHRTLIREEYKAKFCEDFDHRLSRELQFKPKLQRAVLLWMDEPACRDAKLVKHGLSIHMNVAIEVICSRTPSQIEQLKDAYHTMFGVDLLEDIKSHAHFDHKKLLLAFAGNQRSEVVEVDEVKVDEDAKVLFKDGEWKLGTNQETFIRTLSERSSAHLAALNSAYQIMYVNSLKKAVKKETSFKFKFGLLTILQCVENRGKYFAKALHKAMKGVGTKDETLTRIIVSRAEVDIEQIKIEYRKKYGKELSDDVHSDTSGHYRAFLLSLLNHKVA